MNCFGPFRFLAWVRFVYGFLCACPPLFVSYRVFHSRVFRCTLHVLHRYDVVLRFISFVSSLILFRFSLGFASRFGSDFPAIFVFLSCLIYCPRVRSVLFASSFFRFGVHCFLFVLFNFGSRFALKNRFRFCLFSAFASYFLFTCFLPGTSYRTSYLWSVRISCFLSPMWHFPFLTSYVHLIPYLASLIPLFVFISFCSILF